MTAFNNLVIERHEPGICVVKISRPKALNALNTETLQELKQALTAEAFNRATRVVVLTGEGDKAFIAGADILEMNGKSTSEAILFAQRGHEVARLLEKMPKPTIAAVNGFALGGGTEMALACDFILAADNAVFGQPEVSIGVIPGFGGTFRLTKAVGLARAKELIFSGRKVTATEALEIGLCNHVYPAAEFSKRWLELARSIATQSQSAVSKAKEMLNEFTETLGLNFKADAEAQAFGMVFGSADQREGMAAFIEKRKPGFAGL